MKIIKYIFEAIFFYILFFLIRVLGLNIGRKICSFLFLKIGYLFRPKSLIKENIFNALGDISSDKVEDIIVCTWKNYGNILAEYVHLDKFRLNKFLKPHVHIIGKEILDEVIKSKKPAIFVSGHFGSFELMAMELEKKGINLAAIYRPLNNIFLDPFMVFLRKKYICKNQIKKGITGTREVINFVKKNYSIALMVDQRVGESERSPFFNIPAHTTTMPSQLALKFNLEIVPIYLERKNDNSFIMEVLKPIVINKTDSIINNDSNNVYLCKYSYLNALSKGYSQNLTNDSTRFENALAYTVQNCKSTDFYAPAKQLLDKLRNIQSIENAESGNSNFIYNSGEAHFFALYVPKGSGNVNSLKVKISNFNKASFSGSNLKTSSSFLNSTDQLILVKQFNNVSGVMDYYTAFKVNNTQLKSINANHDFFVISDKNLAALYLEKNLQDYLLFFENNYLK